MCSSFKYQVVLCWQILFHCCTINSTLSIWLITNVHLTNVTQVIVTWNVLALDYTAYLPPIATQKLKSTAVNNRYILFDDPWATYTTQKSIQMPPVPKGIGRGWWNLQSNDCIGWDLSRVEKEAWFVSGLCWCVLRVSLYFLCAWKGTNSLWNVVRSHTHAFWDVG